MRTKLFRFAAVVVALMLGAALLPSTAADAKVGNTAGNDHVSVDAYYRWAVSSTEANQRAQLTEFSFGSTPTSDGFGLVAEWGPTAPTPGWGHSVAIGRNTNRNDPLIVVGAPDSDQVFLYSYSGGAVNLITTIAAPPDPGAVGSLRFGASVDTSAGKVIVGAPGTNGGQGAAYVYDATGTPLATLTEPAADIGAETGTVVQIEGDTAWVGAPGQEVEIGVVFEFDVSTGLLTDTIKPDVPQTGMRFGSVLSADPARVLIGGENLTSAFLQQGINQTEIASNSGNVITDVALEGNLLAFDTIDPAGVTELFTDNGNTGNFVYFEGTGTAGADVREIVLSSGWALSAAQPGFTADPNRTLLAKFLGNGSAAPNKIVPVIGAEETQYGNRIDVDGSTMVSVRGVPTTSRGQVVVARDIGPNAWSPTGWTARQFIDLQGPVAGGIVIDGDTFVVSMGDGGDAGAPNVAIYQRASENDPFTLLSTLRTQTGAPPRSLAIDETGQYLALGLPNPGLVEVYDGGPAGWASATPQIIIPNDSMGTGQLTFGWDLDFGDGLLLIGKPATQSLTAPATVPGMAELWLVSPAEVTYFSDRIPSNSTAGDAAGWSVEIEESVSAVASPALGTVQVFRSGLSDSLISDPSPQGAVAYWGFAMDLDAGVLAVSDWLGDTAAYGVYGPAITILDTFQASDLEQSDYAASTFPVATSDGNVFTGARLEDWQGRDAGAAYVFTVATSEPPVGPRTWPTVVDIDNGYAAVGNPAEDTVHVLRHNGAGWVEVQQLLGVAGTSFGAGVAMEGDILVVGSPDANSGSGLVNRYDRGDNFLYTAGAFASNPNSSTTDSYGADIDISGDWIVVGAAVDGANGSAVVYDLDLANETVFTSGFGGASIGTPTDEYGAAVATGTEDIGGVVLEYVWVGSPGTADGGAVYGYRWDGAAWQLVDIVAAAAGDRMGASLEANGNAVLIGAEGDGPVTGNLRSSNWTASSASLSDVAATFTVGDVGFNGNVVAALDADLDEVNLYSNNGQPGVRTLLGAASAGTATGTSIALDGDWVIAATTGVGLDWTQLAEITAVSTIAPLPNTPDNKTVPEFGSDGGGYATIVEGGDDIYVVASPADPAAGIVSRIDIYDSVTDDLLQTITEKTVVDGSVTDLSLNGDRLAVLRANSVEVLQRVGRGAGFDVPGWVVPVTDGTSVAIEGDLLVVGQASLNDAAVFELAGGVWNALPSLTPAFADTGASYGAEVAISGNVIVVGADYALGLADGGYVTAWARADAASPFVEDASRLQGTEYVPGDRDGVGSALAFDGSWLVAGAPLEDTNGGDVTNPGVVYVWKHDGAGTFSGPVLLNPDGLVTGVGITPEDSFAEWGTSVALADGVIVAGGPFWGARGVGSYGAAVSWRFDDGDGAWVTNPFVEGDGIAADGDLGDALGAAIAITGGTRVVAGAPAEDASGLDAGAFYTFTLPVIVDPGPENKLIAEIGSDPDDGEAGDAFGGAATDGQRLVISAPEEGSATGGVHLYTRNAADDGWDFDRYIANPDTTAEGSRFGISADVEGDLLVVGAPFADGAAGANAGTVWLFDLSVDPIGVTELPAPVSRENHFYGISLDLDGDVLAIGARGNADDGAGGVTTFAGELHVFERDGVGDWNNTLIRPGEAANAQYTATVSVDGDRMAVGALGAGSTGYVEVLERNAVGSPWLVTQTFTGDNVGDQFGFGMDLDGNNLAVASPGVPEVKMFTYHDGAWDDGIVFSDLGEVENITGVDIDGTIVIVGDQFFDDPDDEGRAVVYGNTDWLVWSELTTFDNPDPAPNDFFGAAVTAYGDGQLIIGAPRDDNRNGTDAGAAYLFDVTPPPPPTPPVPVDPTFIAEITYDLPSTVSPGATTVTIEGTAAATTSAGATAGGGIVAASIGAVDLSAPEAADNPLGDILLGQLGIDAAGAGVDALRQIPLTEFPVDGGWAQYLPAQFDGVPLQAITLGDVWDLPSVQSIPLRFADIEASPLRFADIAAIGFGELELLDIDLDGDPATSPFDEWCSALSDQGVSCADIGIDSAASTVTLGTVSAAGVNVEATPLRFAPLRFAYIEASPLRFAPLRFADIESAPLRFAPLRFAPLRFAPLRFAPLRFAPLRFAPLRFADINATPLRFAPLRFAANPESIADCTIVDCNDDTLTLGDVAQAGALLDGFTLDDLGDGILLDPAYEELRIEDLLPGLDQLTIDALQAILDTDDTITFETLLDEFGIDGLGDMTLGDIDPALWDQIEMTIGDFFEGYDEDELAKYSLSDFLLLFIPRDAYEWDDVDLGSINLQLAGMQAPLTASIGFTTGDGPPTDDVTVVVDLPTGSVAQAGTFTLAPTGASIADVFVTDTTATVEIVNVARGEPQLMTFGLYQGLDLGTETSAVSAIVDASTASASDTITVAEAFEPENNGLLGAVPVISDNLYVSHLGSSGDTDFFRLTVTEPSTTVSVQLANLAADYDLVVYGPKLGSIIPSADGGAAASAPTTDFDASGSGGVLSPVPLQDIPTSLDELQVYGASYFRGTDAEQVDFFAVEAGDYFVQVSGYLGASSPKPYSLRAATTPTVELACPARNFQFPAGTPGSSTTAAGADTLVLMNRSRFEAAYGPQAAADMVAAVDTMITAASGNGISATVIDLDAIGSVQSAYDAWDASPCSTITVNNVVSEIGNAVLGLRAGADIEHLLIVGGDDIVPFGRVKDVTTIANEQSYTTTFTAAENNALRQAFAGSWVLTDDPYADTAPTAIANTDRVVYVPELSMGRLVETPEEIVGALQHYVDFNGQLDPQTGFVAGYDFLNDGAEETGDNLTDAVSSGSVQRLINETWTAGDLQSGLTSDAGGSPDAALVSAHFDHANALPAAGNASGNLNDLFNVEDAEQIDFTGSILFSVGCHGGLSVSDLLVAPTGVVSQDWAQTFLAGGAAAFVGNTGYGYGDDTAVALSEKLMADFAAGLGEYDTIGEALLYAKQDYAADLTVYGAFDEKALMEATLYGIPFYTLGNSRIAEPVPQPPTEPAPTGGVAYTDIFDPVIEVEGDGTEDEIWSTPGENGEDLVQVTSGYPILPRFEWEVTQQQPGNSGELALEARGVVLESLITRDEIDVDPATARAVYDLAANEPNVDASDVTFVLSPAINTYLSPEGVRQDVNMAVGAFQSSSSDGSGTMRLFEEFEATVYYADDPSAEANKPLITGAQANPAGGTFDLAVNVQDDSEVVRVAALVTATPIPNAPTTWELLDLSDAGGGTWQGSVAVAGDEVQWLIMAVDTHGNTAWSMSKQLAFDGTGGADLAPALFNPTAPVNDVLIGTPTSLAVDVWDFSGTGDTLDVVWDFGDGTTCSTTTGGTCELDPPTDADPLGESTATHTWSAPGTYTVTVTVTDAGGMSDTITLDPITVVDEVPLNGSVIANGSAKAGVGDDDILPDGVDGKRVKVNISARNYGELDDFNLRFTIHRTFDVRALTLDDIVFSGDQVTISGSGVLNRNTSGEEAIEYRAVIDDATDMVELSVWLPGSDTAGEPDYRISANLQKRNAIKVRLGE